jgi:single-strand DNA-binding protein
MSIPTQMSLAGFIASAPELHFARSGTECCRVRVGVEQWRKEADGSFTKLDPTFHDMVMFERVAREAYDRFRPGDAFLANGYVHEYEIEQAGGSVIREEFVARKIGHDSVRTTYDVQRRRDPVAAGQATPHPPDASPAAPAPAVGLG